RADAQDHLLERFGRELTRASLGPEADFRVRAVAKGFVGTAAAAAEIRRGHARHGPARAAQDLEISTHPQRAIELRVYRQHTIPRSEHVGLAGHRLTACGEPDRMMRAIAIRLVLRGAAAA